MVDTKERYNRTFNDIMKNALKECFLLTIEMVEMFYIGEKQKASYNKYYFTHREEIIRRSKENRRNMMNDIEKYRLKLIEELNNHKRQKITDKYKTRYRITYNKDTKQYY